jgi:hypothetical protein
MNTVVNPFQSYPDLGRKHLGKMCGGHCRKDYGLALHRITGQTACCYCRISLVDTYDHWLLMSCEHVISEKKGSKHLGIPLWVLDDYSNLALCCSACNAFSQTYKFSQEVIENWKVLTAKAPQWSDTLWQEFFGLRDRVFAEKVVLVETRHVIERCLFQDHWMRHTA